MRVLAWGVGGAALMGLGVFLVLVGLDDADKWASVIGVFVGLAGLGVAVYSAVLTRRSLTPTAAAPPAGGNVDNTISGGTFDQPAVQARDISGLSVGSPTAPAGPPPCATGSSGTGDVRNTISGGTFHQPAVQARDISGLSLGSPVGETSPAPECGVDAVSTADAPGVSNTITGGVFFNAVMQGHTVTVVLPPTVEPALSGLPPASSTFTGRDAQLSLLMQALAPDDDDGPVLVSAVAGLAGVGKTELVVQAAARAVKETGWFPGGVLFVDMFGYDPQQQVSVGTALVGLLQALGLPGEHIPATEADRSRLFRSVLAAYARQGRRILLVIDNAAIADQVIPLLPGDGVTATLITSRHTLDVGARLHDLTVLDRAASVQLLADVLHEARGPADTRIADEAEAAAQIADLCAGLPLALRIVAALLADHPTRPLISLARALATEHNRLDRLTREGRAVRAAFDLSYQRLDDRQALLFRLLPVNPGPDISTESAAHLAELDLAHTEQLLQDLARAHLIEPGQVWGRWRLHNLVCLYADGHLNTGPDQRDRARTRLLEHYRTTTRAANTHLEPPSTTVSSRFRDRAAALAWLDHERPNLTATCTSAPDWGRPDISIELAFNLAPFLNFRRFFDEAIIVATTALTVFHKIGYRHGKGSALTNLGIALRQVRRFDEAIAAHQQAATIFRGHVFPELGDRRGEGQALTNLGIALQQVRRFDEAITAHQQAATIFRDTSDRHNESQTLGNLAIALASVRRFDEAITAHQQALTICVETGDRDGEAAKLTNLGLALASMGRCDEAITAHQQAATIFRDTSDRYNEAMALSNLGLALRQARRFNEAITAHQQAATIFRDTGDRHGEGRALGGLGMALASEGRCDEAITAYEQVATIFREIGDRRGEGAAQCGLAAVLRQVQRFDEARSKLEEAITAFTDSGHDEAVDLVRQSLDDMPPSAAL